MELYKKYRPQKLEDVIGQNKVVAVLQGFIKKHSVPHSLLFTGPSGCGKTTLARIIANVMGCHSADLKEVNASEKRGIDYIRELEKESRMAPALGKCRVWIVDEAHGLTNEAQNSFLKLLEDTPKRAFFFLASTHPEKLLPTVKTRCSELKVSGLSEKDVTLLLNNVATAEGFDLDKEVAAKIVELSAGSARKALVLLESILEITETEDQLQTLVKSESVEESIQLARALMNPSVKWADVAKLLQEIKDDPEGTRRMILGYATTIMLRGGKPAPRAFVLIDAFARNYFDSGRAGLVASCYEVVTYDQK